MMTYNKCTYSKFDASWAHKMEIKRIEHHTMA